MSASSTSPVTSPVTSPKHRPIDRVDQAEKESAYNDQMLRNLERLAFKVQDKDRNKSSGQPERSASKNSVTIESRRSGSLDLSR